MMDEVRDEFGQQQVKMSDEELLSLVRHNVRRRILLTVGSEGKINASTLKQRLGISTGSLYYNLRQLTPLIAQDRKRVYSLSEDGKRIYRILTQSEDTTALQRNEGILARLGSAIFPVWLFAPIYESRVVASVLGALSVFVLVSVLVAGRHNIFLLNVTQVSRPSIPDLALNLAFTILIAYVFLAVISLVMSGRLRSTSTLWSQFRAGGMMGFTREQLKFIPTVTVSFLPLGLLPGLAILDRIFGLELLTSGGIIFRDALLVLSQTITVILLGAAVSYVKKMKWQGGLAVALAYFYLSHGLSLFLR
ncbi:MAG: hypothetical protein QXK39_01925 [Nitrososphaerota archaeon]